MLTFHIETTRSLTLGPSLYPVPYRPDPCRMTEAATCSWSETDREPNIAYARQQSDTSLLAAQPSGETSSAVIHSLQLKHSRSIHNAFSVPSGPIPALSIKYISLFSCS